MVTSDKVRTLLCSFFQKVLPAPARLRGSRSYETGGTIAWLMARGIHKASEAAYLLLFHVRAFINFDSSELLFFLCNIDLRPHTKKQSASAV
ncbi:hypothetical protein EEX84_04840 [Planococcus salinus]|uniref:Uncharacterized protein n=1 Tax=Planococcus salinus TaxID=1848460 RepID=A0A3M8P8I5_9BACL|nr:hypothetical protein EEX84_04840 [Planococcus salinus]